MKVAYQKANSPDPLQTELMALSELLFLLLRSDSANLVEVL